MTIFTFENNISTTIAAAVTNAATTLTLSSAAGLPDGIPTGQSMALTLRDAATRMVTEIVYATAISGTTLTVVRAQEGTSAVAWSAGDYAYSGPTAGQMSALAMGHYIDSVTISATGAFNQTVPAGAFMCRATVIGGGAGGGSCQTQGAIGNLTNASGGGGGSGAALCWEFAVQPGDAITGSVGAAAGSNTNGNSSSVTHGGLTATAGGGFTGAQNSPQSAAGGPGGSVTISAGITLKWRAGGGWGGDGQASAFIFPGNGAGSILGGGGRAGLGTLSISTKAGEDANAPGGGGGGAYSPNLESAQFYFGGNGASGIVILEYSS